MSFSHVFLPKTKISKVKPSDYARYTTRGLNEKLKINSTFACFQHAEELLLQKVGNVELLEKVGTVLLIH